MLFSFPNSFNLIDDTLLIQEGVALVSCKFFDFSHQSFDFSDSFGDFSHCFDVFVERFVERFIIAVCLCHNCDGESCFFSGTEVSDSLSRLVDAFATFAFDSSWRDLFGLFLLFHTRRFFWYRYPYFIKSQGEFCLFVIFWF